MSSRPDVSEIYTNLVQNAATSSGSFIKAVQRTETPPIDWLIENAELEHLRAMCKELLLAIDAPYRDSQWDNLAQLFLDWVATLEAAIEDKDGSLLRAREELRHGKGLSFEEFSKSLTSEK